MILKLNSLLIIIYYLSSLNIALNLQIGALPTLRDPIILNRRPGKQILQNDTDVTITCLRGWKEPDCQTCAHGWTGDNCDICAPNFGPEGQCDSCVTGFAGENCSECAANFGPSGNCTDCLIGWTGPSCDACATNFGPPGQCDSCLTGWAGDNCDVCGFGFSTESRCTECIENGRWIGSITLDLTFEEPECVNVVSGRDKRIPFLSEVKYYTCLSFFPSGDGGCLPIMSWGRYLSPPPPPTLPGTSQIPPRQNLL